jgi:hypothetical protein
MLPMKEILVCSEDLQLAEGITKLNRCLKKKMRALRSYVYKEMRDQFANELLVGVWILVRFKI